MELPDYKARETYNVLDYLLRKGRAASIEEILANVDVDRLRIYPIIIDLQQMGSLRVVREAYFGSPLEVEAV